MRLEIELDAEDVRAVDELAVMAETTRDRVVHWAICDYLHVDDRKTQSIAAHPAGSQRFRRTA